MKIVFTHLWVSEFGWENTIYCEEDFTTVELLGESEKDGCVFIAIQENSVQHIIKGYYSK